MKRGFTLVELLVAVTIGMVLVGFISVSLNGFNEQQKLIAVKQELISNLRLARNYAVTNQLPTGASKVVVTIDNDGLMEIGFDVGDTVFSNDITPKGVNVNFSDPVEFSATDGRSIKEDIIVTISGNDATNETVKIDKSGLIYEK